MITITQLRLENWKCYRGETVLNLEPQAYAVLAREDANPGWSCWLGKSSLVEAIDFALYGRLAEEFKHRKKGWISRGEKRGEVSLVLSDGSIVRRSQQASGSERLFYFPPGSPTEGAVQAEAQKAIDNLVGLSEEDFTATRYFRQGEMSRLIVLKPEQRLDLVAGWLRLEALQGCEDDAAGALLELVRRRDAAASTRAAAGAMIAQLLERAGAKDARELDALIVGVEVMLQDAEEVLRTASAKGARNAERAELEQHAQRYARIVREGTELRAALDAGRTADSLRAEIDERTDALRLLGERKGVAEREAGAKRMLVRGSFDGTCPLVGERCPSVPFVTGGRDRNGVNAQAADGAAAAAREEYEGAARALAGIREEFRIRGVEEASLERLREEGRRLKPLAARYEALPPPEGGEDIPALESARATAMLRLATLGAAAEAVATQRDAAAAAMAEEAKLEVAVRTAAAAVAVFGKAGAQRRMAEGALSEIEERACEMMAGAGIALRVKVQWSREGSGVASTCAACGSAFPRSERVKVCERCGGARGANLVHKLEIEPSAQSGGARDLCGIFVQLAAAAWLVEDRGARWATALLDEPLAALDAHHRRALAAHLPGILRDSGVAQCLVIAHHDGFLDALPGRILVESKDGWSTARVV